MVVFCGKKVKRIHHWQIAPNNLFGENANDDEILKLEYFAGKIYGLELIFEAIFWQREIRKS